LINRSDKTSSTTGRNICPEIKLYMKERQITVSTASKARTPDSNAWRKTQETKATMTRFTETIITSLGTSHKSTKGTTKTIVCVKNHGTMTLFRAWANNHETHAISSNDNKIFRTNGNLKTMGEMTTEEGRDFKEVDHHDQQMSSDFYDYEIVVVVTYETGCTRNTCMTLTLMATYPSLLLIGLLKCFLLTGS